MTTKIEWTDVTWNPWHGCDKIAPECDDCYAATFDARNLHAAHAGVAVMKNGRGEWTGKITRGSESVWCAPFRFPRSSKMRSNSATLVFTCSMSDFWHERVPLEWLDEALDVIERTPHLIYQVLTKRPATAIRRLTDLKRELPANVWFGVTVGHPQSLPLLKPMKRIEATLKFLSIEPLLAPMVPGLDLNGIGWVICGGESGHGARRCEPDWMRGVRDLCVASRTPLFLKQWGTWVSNPAPPGEELDASAKGGATLDGRLWREFPA